MLSAWGVEAQEHWAAAAAFFAHAWASVIVKAATVAISGALIGGVTAGTTMLVRLDTQMTSLERRLDERFTELSAKLTANELSGKERRDSIIRNRDKQIEDLKTEFKDLRQRVHRLEVK